MGPRAANLHAWPFSHTPTYHKVVALMPCNSSCTCGFTARSQAFGNSDKPVCIRSLTLLERERTLEMYTAWKHGPWQWVTVAIRVSFWNVHHFGQADDALQRGQVRFKPMTAFPLLRLLLLAFCRRASNIRPPCNIHAARLELGPHSGPTSLCCPLPAAGQTPDGPRKTHNDFIMVYLNPVCFTSWTILSTVFAPGANPQLPIETQQNCLHGLFQFIHGAGFCKLIRSFMAAAQLLASSLPTWPLSKIKVSLHRIASCACWWRKFSSCSSFIFCSSADLQYRCFCTGMLSHTCRDDFYISLHTNTFTERWFYIEQNYSQMPKQREALLQRNAFARGAFTYGHFCTDIQLPDFWPRTCIWRKKVQPAYAKSRFHRSFLTFETHFVGKGWPSTNPHCNLTSMWRSTCRAWGLHFVDINPCCPGALRENLEKSRLQLITWPPPAPLHLPLYTCVYALLGVFSTPVSTCICISSAIHLHVFVW